MRISSPDRDNKGAAAQARIKMPPAQVRLRPLRHEVRKLLIYELRTEPAFCAAAGSKLRKKEPAVSRVLSWTTIHLGQPSPTASSNLPGSPLRRALRDRPAYSPIWSCSGRGLPCRGVLPPARCALTAPFHPCRRSLRLGGMFSVALSMGSRPPGVTWRPARWSPDFPPLP